MTSKQHTDLHCPPLCPRSQWAPRYHEYQGGNLTRLATGRRLRQTRGHLCHRCWSADPARPANGDRRNQTAPEMLEFVPLKKQQTMVILSAPACRKCLFISAWNNNILEVQGITRIPRQQIPMNTYHNMFRGVFFLIQDTCIILWDVSQHVNHYCNKL